MGHSAIVQFPCNFGEIEFTIHDQLLHLFNFVKNDELFNGGTLCFRKDIGEIGVIIVQLFTEVNGKLHPGKIIFMMHHLNDHILNALNEYRPLIIQQF